MASYKVQCSILYVLYCSTARSRYGIKCNMPCMFDDVPLLDLEEFKHQRELAWLAGAEALLAMAAGYRPGLRTVLDIKLPTASRRSPFSPVSRAWHTAR